MDSHQEKYTPKGQKKMKKFLAIVFALIFALSACTVAFAGSFKCEHCKANFSTEELYKAHINGECTVLFQACEYCAAKISKEDMDAHLNVCTKKADADKKAEDDKLHRYECIECKKVFESKEAFNNHFYYGGCDVMYTTCGYCGDRIHVNCSVHDDCVVEHYKVCIKYSDNCKYCGKHFTDYTAHMNHQGEDIESSECCVRTTIANDDVSEVIGTIIITVVDFFKNTDWGAVLAKVGEVVGGIDFEGLIGKVTGFIGGIDFEGLIGKVTDVVGNIELPAAK